MSAEYRSTWQRWQTMAVLPGFAERRERLQRAEAEPGAGPSAEALDFFEALLATEPKDQLRLGARRLEAQAAALRSRRSAPRAAPEEPFEDFATRAAARREAHEQRLREVEAQAAAEQAELQAEIEREQGEAEARRQAQEAWLEELARRQKAEREKAKAFRPEDGYADAYWRKRWWHYVPRPEPGPKPKPPPNGRSKRREPPESEMLQELRSKQNEPLEVRKKIWRSLCLRWHPDKSEDKDMATKAFQQLSELKPWFLPEAC